LATLTRAVLHATSSDLFLNSRLLVTITYTCLVLAMLDTIVLVLAMMDTILAMLDTILLSVNFVKDKTFIST